MKSKNEIFDRELLIKDLRLEARGLRIPVGAAEIFIDKAVAASEKRLANKKIITKKDLERVVAIELKKYSVDLAYVYKNRDKII